MTKRFASVIQGRRDFLRTAGALAVPTLLGGLASCARPRVPTQTAARTPAMPMGIDMHNHVYPAGTEPHPQWGPPHGGPPPGGAPPSGPPQAGPPPGQEQSPGRELVLADELNRSGLTAVSASFVLDFASNRQPGDARANLLRWFTAIDAELEKGGLRRARNAADLRTAHESGRPTIIQAVEGAHFIEGDLARVAEVYARGLRHLQLLHERDDMVSPLGDTNTGVAHLGGLTAFGGEVVKECNRLGIVVDLAHASHETVLAALKVATQPVIVSHTNLDSWTGANPRMAEMMRPRLISKEHAKVVADAGGVIGVWTHLAGSLQEFVESIKVMVDAVGIDHVGMGTDTDLMSSRAGHGTNDAWPELKGRFFPAVVGEMQRQGFAPGDIAKVGGENYGRVFGAVTGGRA
jgi:membrane dipeptidase